MKKIYFFIPILIFVLLETSLSFAADEVADPTAKLEHYYSENYQEMVFIHTDKPYYLAGEIIRFKVYSLEKITSKPSQLSKVAYVELLDDANAPQIQAKIALQHGTGFGEMYIPTNIKSGNLVLRGYTRWMRNNGPEGYFHALLPIINPFRRLGLQPLPGADKNTINFFPEGESIIDGVESNIVFEIKDGDGYPIDARGRLYANDTMLVSDLIPVKNGLGNFRFQPVARNKYHVELVNSDSTISKHNFPPINHIGISLMVRESGENYTVTLFCNNPALIKSQESILFLVHQNGKIVSKKSTVLNLGKSSFQFEKTLLGDGVFLITALDGNAKVLQERRIFKYNGSGANNLIKVNKQIFEEREKVTIDMDDLSKKLEAEDLDFSISIASHRTVFDQNALSLKNYLLIDNSLKFVYGLETFFEGSTEHISQAINNLLIAHPNKTDWQNIINGGEKVTYIPEYRGPLVMAKITNKETHQPAQSIISYLSIPGKMNQFYASRSKSDGSLAFELKDLYGSNEIIVQNDYTIDSIYSIVVDNPFSTEYLKMDIPVFNIDENMERWIAHQSANMQIENAYTKFAPKLPLLTHVDSSSFYFEPDSRYYLDDFTRFIVMEEVMREYVAGVNVRKNRDGFHFMLIDIDKNIVYDENPLMLLDGVPVFDADEIIALDPLKIKKIETVKKTFHKGILDCQGIVSFATYNGNLEGYSIHKDALVFEYDGIQPQKQYVFPTYPPTYDKRIKTPDFRNTLYWNPKIVINQKDQKAIEFYTSDDANVYEIRIEGLDKEGNAFSDKSIIEVK